MTKKLYLLLILSIATLLTIPTYAKLKKLELIVTPTLIADNSLYQQIEFIDDRSEYEKQALKIDETQFNSQLSSILKNSIPRDTTNNKIVVHLRNLYIQTDDEKEKCYIRISLYENNSDRENLYFINTLNTYLPMSENNKKDQNSLSDLLTTFIYTHLIEQPKEYTKEYVLTHLSDIISLEKSRIKLYQNEKLADGIYNNFRSFADQEPELEISSFKSADSYVKDVKYIDPKNQKETKIKTKQTFAIVVDGNAFLQVKGKYLPVEKDEDNNFIVRVQKSSSTSYGIAFGLIGSVLMPYNTTTEYIELKIDHLNGELSVKSKEIEKTNNHLFSKKPLSSKKKTVEGNDSMKKW